jgi:hypothetical protein
MPRSVEPKLQTIFLYSLQVISFMLPQRRVTLLGRLIHAVGCGNRPMRKQRAREIVRIDRWREIKALSGVAIHIDQSRKIVCSLDSLGHCGHVHPVCQVNIAAAKFAVMWIAGAAVYKATINLEFCKWELG